MRYVSWIHCQKGGVLVITILAISTLAFAQSEVQTRTLTVNGQSGTALVYRINNQSFIDLETLARIGNGSVSFQGDQIILSLPTAHPPTHEASTASSSQGMSKEFMTAAVQDVGVIKDWYNTLAYAISRGVPGDGSRLVVFHDRATEGLRLATVNASTRSDHDALQLLTNHFNQVDHWKTKLVDARKSMATANYSITPDVLDKDPEYQKLHTCSQFLSSMLAHGQYEDNAACH